MILDSYNDTAYTFKRQKGGSESTVILDMVNRETPKRPSWKPNPTVKYRDTYVTV
jgi:hypothetical protein